MLVGCTYTTFPRAAVADTDKLGDIIPWLCHDESYSSFKRAGRSVKVLLFDQLDVMASRLEDWLIEGLGRT